MVAAVSHGCLCEAISLLRFAPFKDSVGNMNNESIRKLRLDRRLIRRRGWIEEQELARELEDLPDAADKAITLGEAADQAGGFAANPDAGKPPAA